MDAARYLYFVTEFAEANLQTLIAAQALTKEETGEMLRPLLQAAAHLHDRGLAHGRIDAANILKVGDAFKLSGDSIRPEGSVFSAAKDIRMIGLTVIQALTQSRQPSLIATLPEPFQEIVEAALRVDPAREWTASAAGVRLSSTMPAAPGHRRVGQKQLVELTFQARR